MVQGLMAITPSQFLCWDKVLLPQLVLVPTMHTSHPRDISLSQDMGTPPTKDDIMNPIMQQGLVMGPEMMRILLMDNRFTQIPGSGNQGILLLELGIRTLPGCIQPVVLRRPISQTLCQPPVHHQCSQRLDTLGPWGLLLFPHHSGQKMSWST